MGGLLRVDPFNPEDSYLVQEIEGTASVGAQMPFGEPRLADKDIALIRDWILGSALPDEASIFSQAVIARLTDSAQAEKH